MKRILLSPDDARHRPRRSREPGDSRYGGNAAVVRKYSIRLMLARANRVMQAARGQLATAEPNRMARCATLLSALGHG